jgi:hypothetical protein
MNKSRIIKNSGLKSPTCTQASECQPSFSWLELELSQPESSRSAFNEEGVASVKKYETERPAGIEGISELDVVLNDRTFVLKC